MVQRKHSTQTIRIHPQATAKPPVGAACNGCGVCCLAEPCPLGMALSGRRAGACRALRWDDSLVMYRCGAVVDARWALRQALPHALQWLERPLAPVLQALAARWIAAGSGCDSSLEVAAERGLDQRECHGAACERASTTMEPVTDPRAGKQPPHHD